ncbi:hypothetical protein CH330_04570, partial [candidate division WOR-3 bacterium JGI_Cruoil_03_51_56]
EALHRPAVDSQLDPFDLSPGQFSKIGALFLLDTKESPSQWPNWRRHWATTGRLSIDIRLGMRLLRCAVQSVALHY